MWSIVVKNLVSPGIPTINQLKHEQEIISQIINTILHLPHKILQIDAKTGLEFSATEYLNLRHNIWEKVAGCLKHY